MTLLPEPSAPVPPVLPQIKGASPIAMLAGLGAGLSLGMAWPNSVPEAVLSVSDSVGSLWLDALRMTIVPLIVALLITAIVRTAEAARAGPLAVRTLAVFLAILWLSAIITALVMPAVLSAFPLSAKAGSALSASLGVKQVAVAAPALGDFLRSLVPSNIVAAAAESAILPLTAFTTLFGFALLRIDASKRAYIAGFFEALGDAMLVMIGWVLWLAPAGVFALAVGLGARAGGAALGALAHYVLIVSAMGLIVLVAAHALASFGAGIKPRAFVQAMVPVQAVAISTQSSLASLPAMLLACERLGVKAERADLVLPLAVALFRATGPAMNLAVAIYVAHWFGVSLSPGAMMAGIAVAATTTLAAVSLPGQLSFISSIAPIALAMGLPIEPLAILIAVEMLPDVMRTMGNVAMDVAVTATVDRRLGDPEEV